MCVALHDASFGQTTVAGWRFHRRRTHCQLYGNQPRNRVTVANAMFLHVPIAHGRTLTQANFIPTSGLSRLLEDMWRAAPKFMDDAGMRSFGGAKSANVAVFDMGSYTWVAATRADPGEIGAALATVRPDRRPQVSQALIEFYLRTWPDDGLAIACFNQAQGETTEPVAIEYVPQDWDILRMPAVDAHGEIPDFDNPVAVNHRLIVGTDEFGVGGRVVYGEWGRMHPRLQEVLPERVAGVELPQLPMANGDFYIDFGRFRHRGGHESPNGHALRAHGAELTSRADQIPMLLG